MANEKQKQMITYILLNYGMGPFDYYDWIKAQDVVFTDGRVTALARCTIGEFRENQWVKSKEPYSYSLTEKAIMQLGKIYE